MSSVDRIELYEYVLNLSKVEDLYQGCEARRSNAC